MNDDIFDNPAWIPHGLNRADVVMAHMVEAQARQVPFLDGRAPFADGTRSVDRASFVAAAARWPRSPTPTIVHVSFCGSTLLARLLDVPGHTTVYREPAIHIDLADGILNDLEMIEPVGNALARPIFGGTPIIKPTNWANSLLPHWVAREMIRPIFITMKPRDFLIAVFRGGRERIAYTLRVAQHLGSAWSGGAALLTAATRIEDNALSQAARLVLVALEIQCGLFRDARAKLNIGVDTLFEASRIFRDPSGAARDAAKALGFPGLPVPTARASHAKDSARNFSSAQEAEANAAVERYHGSLFDAATAWAEELGLTFQA